MTHAVATLVDNCISGITANEARCKQLVDGSVGIATALCPFVGYKKSAEIAKLALKTNKTVREVVLEQKLLTPQQLDTVLDPRRMTTPLAMNAPIAMAE